MRAVHSGDFYHEGRGPELLAVHLAPRSAHLVAIDYALPDAEDMATALRHLRFVRAQTYMFTPVEVED
jgi:hypothetical protein